MKNIQMLVRARSAAKLASLLLVTATLAAASVAPAAAQSYDRGSHSYEAGAAGRN